MICQPGSKHRVEVNCKEQCDECKRYVRQVPHWFWCGLGHASLSTTLCLKCFVESYKGIAADLRSAMQYLRLSSSVAPSDEYEDSIPDTRDLISDPAEEVNRLDALVTIEMVYDYCFGLNREKAGNRTEGIMATCPLHPGEAKPSAWLNIEKQLICCGHDFVGLNKYGLYCLARNLENTRENFFEIKRRLVYEFHGIDPYSSMRLQVAD